MGIIPGDSSQPGEVLWKEQGLLKHSRQRTLAQRRDESAALQATQTQCQGNRASSHNLNRLSWSYLFLCHMVHMAQHLENWGWPSCGGQCTGSCQVVHQQLEISMLCGSSCGYLASLWLQISRWPPQENSRECLVFLWASLGSLRTLLMAYTVDWGIHRGTKAKGKDYRLNACSHRILF